MRSIRLPVRGQPLVHLSVIPSLVLHLPGMTCRRNLLCTALARVQMKRKEVAAWIESIRLIKVRPAAGQIQSIRVLKSSHAGQSAK